MNLKIAAILLSGFLLTACSDPKEARLPADVTKWTDDSSLVDAVKKLDDSEKKLFIGYTARRALASAFGGAQTVSDITVGDALKAQQAWLDEKAAEEVRQKALAEQVKAQQLESLKEMNNTLTVSLVELKLNPKNYENKHYSEYFTIRIAFKNNASEALSGVKGTVILRDMFGDVIKRIGLTDDTQINPGTSYIYNGTIDYNQFKAEDNKLASADPSKLQFEWEPGTYIFASGKKLVMPQ